MGSWVQKYVGKGFMMTLGCAAFFSIGLIGYVVDAETLKAGKWATLIGIYIIMGNGRTVFESTNRAVFADFFPDTTAGAFAFLGVQSGLAGAFGFLVFTPFVGIKPELAAELLVIIGALSLVLVPLAFYVNAREKRTRELNQ